MYFCSKKSAYRHFFDRYPAHYQACRLVVGLLLLVLGGLTNPAQAQNYCDPAQRPANVPSGGFTTDYLRGCAPLTVNVTPNTGIVVDAYTYIYTANGLPTTGVTNRAYTYTAPGSYTIVQIGSSAGTGTFACQLVQVLPTTPVDFSVTSCAVKQATLTFNLDADTRQYDFMDINWGDGTPVQRIPVTGAILTTKYPHNYAVATGYVIGVQGGYNNLVCKSVGNVYTIDVRTAALPTAPVVSQVLTKDAQTINVAYTAPASTTVLLAQKSGGVYPPASLTGGPNGVFSVSTDATQVQCFQLTAVDGCGLIQTGSEVCSLVLTATATNKQNNLTWQPYAGTGTPIGKYTLVRNSTLTLAVAAATNKATNNFTDAIGIFCNVPYCYVLTATAGPTTITSAPVCVTGLNQDVPGALSQGYVSVEGDQLVRFQVLPPTVGATASYSILVGRADSPQGPFQPVGQVENNNVYRDTNVKPDQQSYCYQASYLNSCGLQGPVSAPVCTVWLSSQSPSGVGIDWSADNPFAPGKILFYTLEISDSTGSASQQIDVKLNTSYAPDLNNLGTQTQRYRIVAVAGDGTLSYSNYYTLRREPSIYAPSAFTPNDDALNNIFLVKGTFLDNFTLTVFDRWGSPIFQSTSPSTGWDGTLDGTPLPEGPYLYRVRVADKSGKETTKDGTVTLIRYKK